MEETGTNIHIELVRRNNFLGENPISGEIVASLTRNARPQRVREPLQTVIHRFMTPLGARPKRGRMTEQEPARTV
ncbi:hypothetical protein OKW43_002729 [Paraburkholderia sp. WC7.3g]